MIFDPQAHPNPSGNWTEWLLAQLYIPNPLAEEVGKSHIDFLILSTTAIISSGIVC